METLEGPMQWLKNETEMAKLKGCYSPGSARVSLGDLSQNGT